MTNWSPPAPHHARAAHTPAITDLETTLEQIVTSAVQTVPGADASGITMTEHGQITSRSPTSDEIHRLDQTQAELGEGPCINAATDPPPDGVVMARDLGAETDSRRWPRFAPAAVAADPGPQTAPPGPWPGSKPARILPPGGHSKVREVPRCSRTTIP